MASTCADTEKHPSYDTTDHWNAKILQFIYMWRESPGFWHCLHEEKLIKLLQRRVSVPKYTVSLWQVRSFTIKSKWKFDLKSKVSGLQANKRQTKWINTVFCNFRDKIRFFSTSSCSSSLKYNICSSQQMYPCTVPQQSSTDADSFKNPAELRGQRCCQRLTDSHISTPRQPPIIHTPP